MKTLVEEKLQQLKAEFELGQQALRDLDARQGAVRHMLARIDGAIQVLEELLQQENPQHAAQADPPAKLAAVE